MSDIIGKLYAQVSRGRGLYNVEVLGRKMDPYAKVQFQGVIQRTKVSENGHKTPEWTDPPFEFIVKHSTGNSSKHVLVTEVFEENRMRDDAMIACNYEFDISQYLTQMSNEQRPAFFSWVPLHTVGGKPGGELMLKIWYLPNVGTQGNASYTGINLASLTTSSVRPNMGGQVWTPPPVRPPGTPPVQQHSSTPLPNANKMTPPRPYPPNVHQQQPHHSGSLVRYPQQQQQQMYPPNQPYPPQQPYPQQQQQQGFNNVGPYAPQVQQSSPLKHQQFPPMLPQQQGPYPPQQPTRPLPQQQGPYPPQHQNIPMQQGYPPQQRPIPPQFQQQQGSAPNHPGYPPNQGTPSNHPGYPPQQLQRPNHTGYPPYQGPPNHPGYPPQVQRPYNGPQLIPNRPPLAGPYPPQQQQVQQQPNTNAAPQLPPRDT